jgi:hypothetical protein
MRNSFAQLDPTAVYGEGDIEGASLRHIQRELRALCGEHDLRYATGPGRGRSTRMLLSLLRNVLENIRASSR